MPAKKKAKTAKKKTAAKKSEKKAAKKVVKKEATKSAVRKPSPKTTAKKTWAKTDVKKQALKKPMPETIAVSMPEKKFAPTPAPEPPVQPTPPPPPKKKLGINCEHCDATGICAAGTPYDKSHGQMFGAKPRMTSCVECLEAAGEHRNSKKLVNCRYCDGDGKI